MIQIHPRRWYLGTSAERSGLTPPSDAIGVAFYETDNEALYLWTGTTWVAASGGGTLTGSFTAGEIPFATGVSALDGADELHWDNTNKELSVGAASAPINGFTGLAIVRDGGSPSIIGWGYGASVAAQLVGIRGRGTLASPTAVQANDPLLRLRGRGWYAGPNLSNSKVVIEMFANDNFDGSNQGTGIKLQTTETGTTTTKTRLQVDDIVKLGDVDAGDTITVDDNGQIELKGTARTKIRKVIPATDLKISVSAPTLDAMRQIGTTATMLANVMQFSNSVQNDVYFMIEAPTDLDETVDVKFILNWLPGASWTSGNYVWKLEYIIKDASIGDASTDGSTTISMDVTPSDAVTFLETFFTSTIDLNLGGSIYPELLFCHLYRDVASDNGDTVGDVIAVAFEYTKRTMGLPI